jgi:hypothetical protein
MPRRRAQLVLALVALAAAGAGLSPARAAPVVGRPAWVAAALTELAKLRVRPAGPMARYSRAKFGVPWADVDRNRCDTRDDILRRDLTKVVLKVGSTCVVESGTLKDPYTGRTIHFVRGVESSGDVQIDHVVPLAEAWRTGASRWGAARRLAYANDPFVLLAVDGPSNEAKSDADASEWLPPKKSFGCRYVAAQIAIKTKYSLWVTLSEHDAMARVLGRC